MYSLLGERSIVSASLARGVVLCIFSTAVERRQAVGRNRNEEAVRASCTHGVLGVTLTLQDCMGLQYDISTWRQNLHFLASPLYFRTSTVIPGRARDLLTIDDIDRMMRILLA